MPTQQHVEATLADYKELVTIETTGKYIIIRPKRYLAKKWQPIMDALNHAFPKQVEWPKGLGKQGHWRVLISTAVNASATDVARRIDNIISLLMALKNDLAGKAG